MFLTGRHASLTCHHFVTSLLAGTEPWSFYLFNCLLNFNLTFVFALLAPLLLVRNPAVLPSC